jgi:capsular polysaccharide biosynthesis protein
MDLLTLLRTLRRYKLATIPIVILTGVAAGYLLFLAPSTYQTKSTVIMVSPSATTPTTADIVTNPALAKVHANNPYTRNYDPVVVANVVLERLTSDQVKTDLIAEGSGTGYQVTLSAPFGYSTPILEIDGAGSSPAAALKSVTVVDDAVATQLLAMQTGVDPQYQVTSQIVTPPSTPVIKVSAKLRGTIAVCVLGLIALFVAISIGQAMTKKREERSRLYLPTNTSMYGGAPVVPPKPATQAVPERDPAGGR